ncbi:MULTISPECIES: hypothetical protein [Arthrobacter]|uniref:Uncharacterized protein n=2 Tax=Arthrobacter TaxID=1663 RepID=A0ABU9KP12_9MICC|nr:hypothetical protein [Arthrobacter sp. YJM1]MDP5228636.1 hypothetical protein [Arthrobacter sp. YJM1]
MANILHFPVVVREDGGVADPDAGKLPGPSAYVLYKRLVHATTVSVCAWGSLTVLSSSKILQPSWFTDVLVGAAMVAAVPMMVIRAWAGIKDRAETREGYTSLPRRRKDLPQRDPYLGEVIREAGADYLPKDEFFAVRDRAKALAERLRL